VRYEHPSGRSFEEVRKGEGVLLYQLKCIPLYPAFIKLPCCGKIICPRGSCDRPRRFFHPSR
jgi:hypothetical protein